MMGTRFLLFFLSGIAVNQAAILRQVPGDDVIATLSPTQRIRGSKRVLSTNDEIYTFLGIRYADPPTGYSRFDEARPSSPLFGTVDALSSGPQCMQSAVPTVPESEDCLFLDIYTPSVNGSLPVMVWIHGGAFHAGASRDFDGSTMATKGAVIVTFNYRLGPFGFLSTGDDFMPGNYGLMDQLLVLKWVQKYIQAFGGDPSRVTIFGESAGAASVSLHLLSPLSKGLFHKAIMQSGSFMCPWVVERPGTLVKLRDFANGIGTALGCDTNSSQLLADCLRRADGRQLLMASLGFRSNNNVDIVSTPRVETKFGFVPDYPENLIKQGIFNQADALHGYNSGEWSTVINDPEDDGISRAQFRANFDVVPHIYPAGGMPQIAQVAERIYITNVTDPIQIRTQLVNVNTDLAFAAPLVFGLKKLGAVTSARNYLFEFDYRKSTTVTPPWMGVVHADELELLFFKDDPNADANDRKVANLMQEVWTNFAKSSDPSPNNGPSLVSQIFTGDSLNMFRFKMDMTGAMTTYPRPEAIAMYEEILPYFNGQSAPVGPGNNGTTVVG